MTAGPGEMDGLCGQSAGRLVAGIRAALALPVVGVRTGAGLRPVADVQAAARPSAALRMVASPAQMNGPRAVRIQVRPGQVEVRGHPDRRGLASPADRPDFREVPADPSDRRRDAAGQP